LGSPPSKRRLPLLLGHGKNKALRRNGDKKVSLNLTSMIDMFTILLIFLIKSYGVEGQIVTVSDALTLPVSGSDGKMELNLEIVVTKNSVIVDGEPVVYVNEEILAGRDSIPVLVDRLSDHMEYTRRIRGIVDAGKYMEVNIRGDVAIPAILLQRVMSSCAVAGYSRQNLIVIKTEGSGE